MSQTESCKNAKALASEEMRNKILETTIYILGTEGYEAVTARNLSSKAGISKGVLYHHFANLDEIKHTTLQFLIEQCMHEPELDQFANMGEYLKFSGAQFFDAMAQNPIGMRALYAFISYAMIDSNTKARLRELMEHSLCQYRQVLSHFCPELDEQTLKSMVQVVDAFFGGTVIQWFVSDDIDSCRRSWTLFADVLIAAAPPQHSAS